MYGLTNLELKMIQEAISSFDEIEIAKIFGSRARGDYSKASDIDIAIIGKNITHKTLSKLHYTLEEELSVPYYFDVIHYDSLTNLELKNEIDISSKSLYEKTISTIF